MPVIDHFDFIAPLYERIIPFREPEKLISLVGLPVNGPLLDAAGGTGRIAQCFRGSFTKVIVADLSMGMLRQAAEKNGIDVVCSATERLPFPGDYFEKIIMVDALHHVYNHQETARELWRVLKPGGWIVIEEMDVRTLPVKLVAIAEKATLMRSHFIKPARIAALFPHVNASVRIIQEWFNAWIVVEKSSESIWKRAYRD